MMRVLTTPWMTALVAALVYLGATLAFWKTPVRPVVDAAALLEAEKHLMPSWDFVNPEADQLLADLRSQKKELDKRQDELNDFKTRLESERAELSVVTQTVRQLQNDFDQNVARINEEETGNLKKLGKVYASMDPASASKIMQEMDDAAIIKIMAFMKDSETAGILEALAKAGSPQAKRAAALSDRLRLVVAHPAAATAPAAAPAK